MNKTQELSLTVPESKVERLLGVLTKPFSKRNLRRAGMTLIEIMIVVALLATLMGILMKNVISASNSAKRDQTKIAIGNLVQSLQMYRVHNNKYPTTAQGLDALMTKPDNAKNWQGPYTENNKLKDPWDNAFTYESDGDNITIRSAGPDGKMDTDDDIVYPEPDDNAAPAAGGGGGGASSAGKGSSE